MVSPPEPAAGTSTGGSWMTSSCAPESTRTVASGSVSGPGPRRAASSATRKRTARMPAAPGVEVRTTYRLACVLATAGRLLPECRVSAFLVGHEHGYSSPRGPVGGGHRAASNARAGARVSAEAVQRRGAGAEGPGGAGVEATAGGGGGGGRGGGPRAHNPDLPSS